MKNEEKTNQDNQPQIDALKKIIATKKVIQKPIVKNRPVKLPPIQELTEEEQKKLKEEIEERKKKIDKHRNRIVNYYLYALLVIIYLISMYFD